MMNVFRRQTVRRLAVFLVFIGLMLPQAVPVVKNNTYIAPSAISASYFNDLFKTIDWAFILKEWIKSVLTSFFKPCFCGVPFPIGFVQDYWSPSGITEVVHKNGDFALAGISLPIPLSDMTAGEQSGDPQLAGGDFDKTEVDSNTYAKHAHVWTFPLLALIGLDLCGAPGFGIGYASEVDPTWSHPELAATLNPLILLLSSFPAAVATAADCGLISAVGNNAASDKMFFSAGCYGVVYPDSGRSRISSTRFESDLAFFARSLSKAHFTATFFATTVEHTGTVCSPTYYPVIPRNEYLFSMIWPGTSLRGRYTKFAVGVSTMLFPELGMNIPTKEDETLMLIYKHKQCCLF